MSRYARFLLVALEGIGVTVRLDGDRLAFDGATDELKPDDWRELETERDALVAELRRRAAA